MRQPLTVWEMEQMYILYPPLNLLAVSLPRFLGFSGFVLFSFVLVFFSEVIFVFMYMNVCLDVCVCTICVQCWRRPEESVRFPGTGL